DPLRPLHARALPRRCLDAGSAAHPRQRRGSHRRQHSSGDAPMTSAAQRILIIGGGFSGVAAAIELRKLGADVDLVEIDPGWRSYGAGISLGGATLRAFRQLGVLDDFLREGNAAD